MAKFGDDRPRDRDLRDYAAKKRKPKEGSYRSNVQGDPATTPSLCHCQRQSN